jgi:hypothetical protein
MLNITVNVKKFSTGISLSDKQQQEMNKSVKLCSKCLYFIKVVPYIGMERGVDNH